MNTAQALKRALRTIPDFPKAGVQFKDITPIMVDPVLLDRAVDELAAPFAKSGVTKVIGVESRGFILGPMVALRLGAGFIPVRKKGKLPYDTFRVEYALEYGVDAVEMHMDAVGPHDRVLIHDDVLATGGTGAACFDLVVLGGAEVAGYSFLLELADLGGRARLSEDVPVHAVLVT